MHDPYKEHAHTPSPLNLNVPSISAFIMNSSIKTIGVILLLLTGICSGIDAKGFRNVVNPTNPSREVAVEMKMRELIADDAFLDYVKPIPNPRHEKGKPGGGN